MPAASLPLPLLMQKCLCLRVASASASASARPLPPPPRPLTPPRPPSPSPPSPALSQPADPAPRTPTARRHALPTLPASALPELPELLELFHVYAPEFKDAVTADEKLQVAALELQVKNSELLHVRKLLLRLELSPIFGSVGLAGYLLSLLYRAVVVIVLWMANSNGGDSPTTDGDVKE